MEKMNSQPTKESVRAWLQERQKCRQPPPSIDAIRRKVGWQTTHTMADASRDVTGATPRPSSNRDAHGACRRD
jgi:hypothetical protein